MNTMIQRYTDDDTLTLVIMIKVYSLIPTLMLLSFLQDVVTIKQPPVLTCNLTVFNSSFNEMKDCSGEREFKFPNVEIGENYTYNVNITNIVGSSSKRGVVGMWYVPFDFKYII